VFRACLLQLPYFQINTECIGQTRESKDISVYDKICDIQGISSGARQLGATHAPRRRAPVKNHDLAPMLEANNTCQLSITRQKQAAWRSTCTPNTSSAGTIKRRTDAPKLREATFKSSDLVTPSVDPPNWAEVDEAQQENTAAEAPEKMASTGPTTAKMAAATVADRAMQMIEKSLKKSGVLLRFQFALRYYWLSDPLSQEAKNKSGGCCTMTASKGGIVSVRHRAMWCTKGTHPNSVGKATKIKVERLLRAPNISEILNALSEKGLKDRVCAQQV